MENLQLLWRYISRHKLSYSLGIVAVIATNWMAVTIPGYIQKSIDLLSHDLANHQETLTHYLAIMLSLACGMVVVRTLSRIWFFNPGRAIECDLKNDMFAKLMQLSKDYYDHNPSGSIISRINNDIMGVRLICGFGMLQIFNILSALSLGPWKMWQLSPRLTLYCVIPIVLVFTVVRIGMRFLVKNQRAYMERLQQLSGFTVASLSGVDVIKSFSMASWVEQKFQTTNQSLTQQSLNISWLRSFVMPVLGHMENILKTVILLVGGIFVIQEDFSIGQLMEFLAYAGLLTMPLMGLGWLSTLIQQGLVGLASMQTILAQRNPYAELAPLPQAERTHLFDQGLEVKNLNFRYPGQTQNALRDISFRLEAGQTIGLLGRIGSGKTTLVNCLNRYLLVERGQIFLGGRDVNDLAYGDLRYAIRTVTQDPFLFSDTVTENIRFGTREEAQADAPDFHKVVYESALEDEIRRFPKQEETLVGEKGIMLSGGQKQRISLARSMMAPCDLLILDNVLSAVDYETERFLLQHIFQRKYARSLLIVSHRARAVEQADLILVLEEGRIVDRGTHSELLQRPGYYRDTWSLQNDTPSLAENGNS